MEDQKKYRSFIQHIKLWVVLFFIFPSLGFIFFKTQSSKQLVEEYLSAKKNKNCAVLKKLSDEKDFSLKKVSYVRFYKLCPEYPDNKFHWSHFPSWLKKEAIEASFHRASEQKDIQKFVQYARDMSRFSKDKNEKIRYTQHAIKVARENQMKQVHSLRKRLYRLSPSRNPNPRWKNYLPVARDYKRRGLYSSSIDYYRKVLNSKKATIGMKRESFQALQQLYKRTHQRNRYQKAVRQYEIFQRRYIYSKTKKYYFDNQMALAKRYWNIDKPKKALNILSLLERQKKSPLMDIYWLKGKIYENITQHKKAVDYFKKSLKKNSNKKGELYEDMLWTLAWNLRESGQGKKALEIFQQLRDSFPFSPRYVYWQAQTFKDLDQRKKARNLFNELIEEAPFDYHGILSHHQNKTPLSLRTNKKIQKEKSKNSSSYQIIDHLIMAQENDLVLSFLEYKIEEYQKRKVVNYGDMFQLFKKSAQAGFYLPFFRFIGGLPIKEKNIFIKNYAELLFPQIYKKEVQKASTLFSTPAEMIYSIMRQESAFNPKARSPADAMGLMQVLPRVAKQAAKREGIAYRSSRDLYNPRINILIGTAHLKDVFSRYGNYFILNLAIYNAGHRPVLQWLDKFSTKESTEFIQNIPYRETRYYVKLIIRNFVIYQLLNNPRRKIRFPEWILELPNDKNSITLNL